MLLDRRSECEELDRLVGDLRTGRSRALVLSGDVGIGKTALLDYALDLAAGCRTIRTAGVEAERELAFAALHQLCTPMLSELHALPPLQRDALRTALGLGGGNASDRFMLGLAALGLFSEVAVDRPLLLLLDDAQWLDRASAQVLGVAARRLGTESVGIVLAARTTPEETSWPELAGLPEVRIAGLPDEQARALLALAHPGPVDSRVMDRLIAECQGKPAGADGATPRVHTSRNGRRIRAARRHGAATAHRGELSPASRRPVSDNAAVVADRRRGTDR